MKILTELTQEINKYHQLILSYDGKKSNTIRFLIENYNDAADIIEKINHLHPDMKNHYDLSEMLDSTMYSEFMKVHKKSIKSIEGFAQKCAYVLETMLVFCANQEAGDIYHIEGISNKSPKEELLEGVQTIIKNVEDNDDAYLDKLINLSKSYQAELRNKQNNNNNSI